MIAGIRFRWLFVVSIGMLGCVVVGSPTASAMTFAEAAAMPVGSTVTIDEAVIINRTNMVLDYDPAASQMFQVRDDTRAASIFLSRSGNYDINGFLGPLDAGDVIRFTAVTHGYYGLFELIEPAGPATKVATPTIDTSLDATPVQASDFENYSETAEGLESRYVLLQDITFDSGVGEPFQYNTHYTAHDSMDHVVNIWMRSQASVYTLNAKFGTVPEGPFDLPGIFFQAFDPVDPPIGTPGGNYLLMPVVVGLQGDLNGDGYVGLDDLAPILNHWNQSVDPGDISAGDANGDGYVGLDDLQPVLDHWNEGTLSPAYAIPEPGMGVWLLGSLPWLTRRRRSAK